MSSSSVADVWITHGLIQVARAAGKGAAPGRSAATARQARQWREHEENALRALHQRLLAEGMGPSEARVHAVVLRAAEAAARAAREEQAHREAELREAQRREAARRSAQDKLRTLVAQVSEAQQQLRALGADPGSWVPGPIPEAMEEILTEVTRSEALVSQLRTQAARLRTAAGLSALVADVQAQQGMREDQAQQALREIVQRVGAALDSLDPQAPAALHERIEARVRECLEAQDSKSLPEVELILTDVRYQVQRANRAAQAQERRAAAQRVKDAQDALDLLERLEARHAQLDPLLMERVMAVADGHAPLTADLRMSVEQAIAAAEPIFVAHTLKDALLDLGYDVQEEFQTLFAQGRSGTFQRPGWGDHHVQLELFDHERLRLNVRVVREGEPGEQSAQQRLRDREMQERWCAELPVLQQRLAQAGVNLDFTRRAPPGQIEVEVIQRRRSAAQEAAQEAGKETISEGAAPQACALQHPSSSPP